ncbi:MAG: hypothetical protein C5S38_02000 [Candidatus Methanophagaceae archaeon]|nr:MAG: hypothetical protein C5S38_02000 [Methanophagales archaeon]KAF5435165.1 hypothetical protein C5S36_03715 [Methanophagales archaeon]
MKKVIIIVSILVLIFFAVVVFMKYNKYASMKSIYETSGWLRVLSPLNAYYENYNNLPTNSNDFNRFLENEYMDYKHVQEFLNIYEYEILYKNDSLYVYSYGFDNIDDKCETCYFPDDYSFIKSIFLKGDIILFKHRDDFIEWNKREEKRYNDSINEKDIIQPKLSDTLTNKQ